MANVQEILDRIEKGTRKEERDLIKRAYLFAEKAHAGQKRNSGEPYFVHCLETAKVLAKLGMDSITIAAGLIHDTLEDTSVTEEDIRKEFGEEILSLVQGVTKLGKLKYRGHDRHVESLRKFFMAMANDLRVVIIKFADRLHNLRTLEYVREDKRRRIAIESIEVYAALANRLGMGKLKGELEDAAFPYAYPAEYKEVIKIIEAKKEPYERYLREVKDELEKRLKDHKIKVEEMSYRIKHKYSLWQKLKRYEKNIDKIYDIVALRIVVDSVEDCYRVLGIIHSIWKPLPGRIKDYIALSKPNGYRSLHTSIFTKLGGVAEIQIRTQAMHAEAAYGIAAHFAYKENGSAKAKHDKGKFDWIDELKNLQYDPEKPNEFIDKLKMDFFSQRIFVFTPTGDVIDLPEGSCVVDFAYAIHSELGDHTSQAKINGKMSQVTSILKNGDIVEIIKNSNAHPRSKWLEYTKTNVAHKHIKSYIEKNKDILVKKLKNFGK